MGSVGEKVMVLHGGWFEMVENSCLKDLKRRMRLKRTWILVPQVGGGKKRGMNEWR